jgi:hypothetical protein
MIEMFAHIEKPENSVEDSIKEHRMKICRSCDHFNKIQTCAKCGCFMPLKTWFKIFSCPDGKW